MCYNSSSRLDEFMAGFNAISLKLKEMYQVCEPCFLFCLKFFLLSLGCFQVKMTGIKITAQITKNKAGGIKFD